MLPRPGVGCRQAVLYGHRLPSRPTEGPRRCRIRTGTPASSSSYRNLDSHNSPPRSAPAIRQTCPDPSSVACWSLLGARLVASVRCLLIRCRRCPRITAGLGVCTRGRACDGPRPLESAPTARDEADRRPRAQARRRAVRRVVCVRVAERYHQRAQSALIDMRIRPRVGRPPGLHPVLSDGARARWPWRPPPATSGRSRALEASG